jgi:hypothetical protein
VKGGCVNLGTCTAPEDFCEAYDEDDDCKSIEAVEGWCFLNGEEGCDHILSDDLFVRTKRSGISSLF